MRLLSEEEGLEELERTIRILHRAQRAGKVTWSVMTRTGWDRFLRLAYKEGWLERPKRVHSRPPKNLLTSVAPSELTPVEDLREIARDLNLLRARIEKVADTLALRGAGRKAK